MAGTVGAATAHEWSTSACVSPAVAAGIRAGNISEYFVAMGERVFVWDGVNPDAATALGGYEYAMDGGEWSAVPQPMVVVSNVSMGAWHSLSVRARQHPTCLGLGVGNVSASFPLSTVTWFEYGGVPGTPAVVSGPPARTSSAYATFTLNATSRPEESWYQYALDGDSWSGCASMVTLGPLSTGSHVLRIRTTDEAGSVFGAVVAYSWTSVSASDSALSFNALSEGHHSLVVVATDRLAHVEVTPPCTGGSSTCPHLRRWLLARRRSTPTRLVQRLAWRVVAKSYRLSARTVPQSRSVGARPFKCPARCPARVCIPYPWSQMG